MSEHLTENSFLGNRAKPNPHQPGRCPSIDPHDELQCGRKIHRDDQCSFGGIAWRKGTPRYVSDSEKVARVVALIEREAALPCDKHPRPKPALVDCDTCTAYECDRGWVAALRDALGLTACPGNDCNAVVTDPDDNDGFCPACTYDGAR